MTDDNPSPFVPKLRFPEFQDAPDWKTGRCRDIAKVLPGYGFPDKFQGNKKGQYPFYKVSDISHTIEKEQRYISEASHYIDSDVLDKIRGKSVPAGTIIFAKIGEAIRSNRRVITTMPAVIDNNTAGVKAMKAKISDEFLFYLWSNVSLIDHAGGVVPAVSKSALENVPLCYPSDLAEQHRIADCLGSLDDLISVEDWKLEAQRQHKQGLMQQLFPQPGETVPRLRFPEFEGAPEWEEERLGNLVAIMSGKSPSQYALFAQGDCAFVKVEDLNNCSKYQVDAREYCNDAQDAVPSGSIVFPKRGAAIENNKIRITASEILIDTNLMALAPRNTASTEFLYYYLVRVGLAQIADTSSIPQINNKHIIPYRVLVPSESEQHRIADCLSMLDALLAAHVEKLNALKTHKQGLLQQIFPPLES